MRESLRIRLNFHICHQLLVYYDGQKWFKSFNALCEYINSHINNYMESDTIPNFIVKIINIIVNKVNEMFDFSEKEMTLLVFDFFIDKQWDEYRKIVLPLKDMYDCNKIIKINNI